MASGTNCGLLSLYPNPKPSLMFLFHYKHCLLSKFVVFDIIPPCYPFPVQPSPCGRKTMLITQTVPLRHSQKFSSVDLWRRLMKMAKGMLCNVVSGRAREAIYLGLAYKEIKTVWRLARGHTWSQRKILISH